MKTWDKVQITKSSDYNVRKLVFTNKDAVAEAVLYKYPTYKERTVICCSTQSGCPVGCRFCGAGDYFVRSLTADEIVEQVEFALSETKADPSDIKKLQIMFMSMGEPLHNVDNLSIACRILYKRYPHAALLVSTSAPKGRSKAFEILRYLSIEIPTIGLQFSVHESTDEARKKLIPTPTSTLKEIATEGEAWAKATGRRPFFNYCVHEKNGTWVDVYRLKEVFDPKIWEATLSVICERDEHVAAANERQRKLTQNFSNLMLGVGYNVRVFNPAGQDDIGGGCGQLWFVQDWMKENPDKAKPSGGFGKEKIHTPKA